MSSFTDHDCFYMQRALYLASLGAGYVSPNPMVGAVLVCDGVIIGEGYHRKQGMPHAEVHAISCVKGSIPDNAVLYVTLEPCSHYGKTPPCVQLIIDRGIKKVMVGTLDPFPQVSGRGVTMLREAGIEVQIGLLEDQCRDLIKFFLSAQLQYRPYILLKWAQSADQYIDAARLSAERRAIQFSTPVTTALVHSLRSQYDAILVGTRTALLDNPSLTVREWGGRSPLRLVIDRNLTLPDHLKLFDNSEQTGVFTEQDVEDKGKIHYLKIDFSQSVPQQIVAILQNKRIQSLIVEGGATLLNSFLAENLWDEIRIETSPYLLKEGIKAPLPNLDSVTSTQIKLVDGLLIETFVKTHF